MNDDFFFLRSFKDINIFSEEEKENIILAKNSEIIRNIFEREEEISDFFINNSFSYLFVSSCTHYLTQSNEFSQKPIDDYMIASLVLPRNVFGKNASTFYIYEEDSVNHDIKNDIDDRLYLIMGSSTALGSSFIKNIRFDYKSYNFIDIVSPNVKSNVKYKDAIFAIMINYIAKEETLSMVNKIFLDTEEALSTYNEFRAKMLFSFFEKEFDLKSYDASVLNSLGIQLYDARELFKKIKETFLMLSSKMIYFDISGDYDRSPSLRSFALTCFNMVKNYSKFLEGEVLSNDGYVRLFTRFLGIRDFYNYYYDFRGTQDSFISVVVELAHIYAEKNNLDLISAELIEKIFENQLSIESKGQKHFKYAVIYSKTIRDNSKIHVYLTPKKLKKTSFDHRKILYIAAINSGNLNKNLVARLAVEKSDIFRDIGSSFFLSRFFYINSKIFKEFSAFKWCQNNHNMFYPYLHLLKKKDFASLFTINLDKNNFEYSQYFNGCKSYLTKKISAYDK